MSRTATQLATDPVREKQLTRRAALLIAEGVKSDKEIARELNIAVTTLQTWKRSPLFVELVNTMGDQIQERGVKAITDTLIEDAPANISFLRGVRDGTIFDGKDKTNARLKAAKFLLDKQAANAGNEVSEDARKIILGGRLLGQMLRAMKNQGAIDVTPEEEDAGRIPVKTPDEFQTEQEATDTAAERCTAEDPDDAL